MSSWHKLSRLFENIVHVWYVFVLCFQNVTFLSFQDGISKLVWSWFLKKKKKKCLALSFKSHFFLFGSLFSIYVLGCTYIYCIGFFPPPNCFSSSSFSLQPTLTVSLSPFFFFLFIYFFLFYFYFYLFLFFYFLSFFITSHTFTTSTWSNYQISTTFLFLFFITQQILLL